MKNNNKGFTLIELVIVIAIISVLGTAVFLNIRPGEILSNSRNATRKSDARNLETALNKALINKDISLQAVTSFKSSIDNSDVAATFAVTGTGYVPFTVNTLNTKLDLSKLPVDPLNGNPINPAPTTGTFGGTDENNKNKYGFNYCANNNNEFEINVYLENDTKGEMRTDGGNNDNAYEVGTNLTICN
jgi:prepilin-type N-terminal cleavage/methylation domain-containing protein